MGLLRGGGSGSRLVRVTCTCDLRCGGGGSRLVRVTCTCDLRCGVSERSQSCAPERRRRGRLQRGGDARPLRRTHRLVSNGHGPNWTAIVAGVSVAAAGRPSVLVAIQSLTALTSADRSGQLGLVLYSPLGHDRGRDLQDRPVPTGHRGGDH